MSMFNIIKHATELVNNPDSMNSENDGALAIQKSTCSFDHLSSAKEPTSALDTEQSNMSLLMHELEGDPTQPDKSTTDKTCNIITSDQKSPNNQPDTFSILDLDRKGTTDPVKLGQVQNSFVPSRLASLIDDQDTSSLDHGEHTVKSVRSADGIVKAIENGHCAAVESEIRAHSNVKTLENLQANSEPVKLKEILCKETSSNQTSTETHGLADSIPAAVQKSSIVIAAEPASDSIPEKGKLDKSKENLKKTSHKYKSDLTATMLELHEYHKDKKPDEYADVHKALQAWSSDEESKTDKTPRNEDNPVSCVLCEFKTLKHSELNQHILIVHVAGKITQKRLKCSDCPREYRHKMALNIHRRKVHPLLLTCPECRYTSRCKFHLIFHQVIYHPDSRAGEQFYRQTWNSTGPYRELYFRLRVSPSLVSKASQPLPKDPFHEECYDFWADLVPSLKIKDVTAKDVVALTGGIVTKIISDIIQGLQIKRQNNEFNAKQSSLQMKELEIKSSYHSEKVFKMLDCPKKDPLPKLSQRPHELPISKKPDIMLMFQDMIRKRYCLLCGNTFNERKKRKRHTIMLDHLFRHFSLRTHYCTQCEITDCSFFSADQLHRHLTTNSELERRKKVMIKAATQERFRTLMLDAKAQLIKRSTDHNAGSTPNIIITPKPSPSVISINNTHQQSELQQQTQVVSVGKENSQQNNNRPLTLLHIVPVTLIQLQPVTVLQCPLMSENTIYKNNCNLIQVDPDRRDDSLSFEEQRFNHDINMLPTANSLDSEHSVISEYNQCRNESIDETYGENVLDELNTEKENPKCLTIPETSSNYSMMVEEPDSSEKARQDAVENVRAPVSDQAKKWFGSINVTDNGEQHLHPTVIFDDYFSFEELRFALFVYAMHTHPKERSTGERKRLENKIRSTTRTRYSRKTSSDSDESDEEDDPYYRIDNDDLPYEPRVELPIERRSYPKRKQKKRKLFTLLDHEPPETDDNRPIERESDETERSEEHESTLTHDSDEFDQILEEDDNFINGIYLEAGYGIDLSFPADDEIFDFAEDSAEGTTRKKQSDVKKEFKDNESSFWFNDVGGLKEENDCKDLKDCHMKSELGKENEDTNSSVTSDRNVEDETTAKSKIRKPTARKSTASARTDKTIVLDKRTKRKLQNIPDEVECTVGKDQIEPIDSSHSSEQFLPNDISLNLPDNIPKLLQAQIRKQVIEKSKLISNQSSSDETVNLETVEPIILPFKPEKVDNFENETHSKKRKRSRKLRYSVPKNKKSSTHKSAKSPGPPTVVPHKSPGPPTVRPYKSSESTFLDTPMSPGPPFVRPLKSPGPPTVRPVEPSELNSLSTSNHPRQVCQRSQPGSAEIPQVVIYEKVQDTRPPASPSLPRVTALKPVLKIRMCDPSAAARQTMCRQTKYFFTRNEQTNELTRQENNTLEPRSSHIQNSQPLPQSSNVTTNRRTPDQNMSVQIIPCPVTLLNFKSCNYCNKRFKSLFCAKIHFWIDHQQLSYDPDLPLPLTRTSQEEIESRVCPYCRFKLVGDSEELFETHILNHLQLLPYLCGVCLFPAVSPNALEKHTCYTERVLPFKREGVVPGTPVVEPKFEVKIEEKPTVTLCHEMSWKGKRG